MYVYDWRKLFRRYGAGCVPTAAWCHDEVSPGPTCPSSCVKNSNVAVGSLPTYCPQTTALYVTGEYYNKPSRDKYSVLRPPIVGSDSTTRGGVLHGGGGLLGMWTYCCLDCNPVTFKRLFETPPGSVEFDRSSMSSCMLRQKLGISLHYGYKGPGSELHKRWAARSRRIYEKL